MEKTKIMFCKPASNAARWLETISVEKANGEQKKYLLFKTEKIKTKYIALSESGSDSTMQMLGITRVKTDKHTICFDEANLQLWWKDPATQEYLVFNAIEVE